MSDKQSSNQVLAELLGWTNIVALGGTLLGKPPAGMPSCRGQAQVPDWLGDWRHCGPLMVRYDVNRMFRAGGDDAAARAWVVRLVIARLRLEARHG